MNAAGYAKSVVFQTSAGFAKPKLCVFSWKMFCAILKQTKKPHELTKLSLLTEAEFKRTLCWVVPVPFVILISDFSELLFYSGTVSVCPADWHPLLTTATRAFASWDGEDPGQQAVSPDSGSCGSPGSEEWSNALLVLRKTQVCKCYCRTNFFISKELHWKISSLAVRSLFYLALCHPKCQLCRQYSVLWMPASCKNCLKLPSNIVWYKKKQMQKTFKTRWQRSVVRSLNWIQHRCALQKTPCFLVCGCSLQIVSQIPSMLRVSCKSMLRIALFYIFLSLFVIWYRWIWYRWIVVVVIFLPPLYINFWILSSVQAAVGPDAWDVRPSWGNGIQHTGWEWKHNDRQWPLLWSVSLVQAGWKVCDGNVSSWYSSPQCVDGLTLSVVVSCRAA